MWTTFSNLALLRDSSVPSVLPLSATIISKSEGKNFRQFFLASDITCNIVDASLRQGITMLMNGTILVVNFMFDHIICPMKRYYYRDLEKLIQFVRPTTVWQNLVGEMEDIQTELVKLLKKSKPEDRLLIVYYNHLWEPVLKLASILGWRKKLPEQNWLDDKDLGNICNLAGWEVVTSQKRMLLPVEIPLLSDFTNKWLAHLPMFNWLCLTTWLVARPKPTNRRDYSVSIIVPARNEEGNIPGIQKSIPKFGKWQEIIFVEGGSKDDTWGAITKLKKQSTRFRIKAYKQKGTGKADAMRLGLKRATGEILMILDGDVTVNPKDLPKFYEVLASGLGEFANGNRMMYPQEREAMRMLNKVGNKVFGWLLTLILGQTFRDTLCGTKVVFRRDYMRMLKNRKMFGNFDPYGDFDLKFGAVKLSLKAVNVPVRYRERTYGSTNISRFLHGWLLLKMSWFGFLKFKAW